MHFSHLIVLLFCVQNSFSLSPHEVPAENLIEYPLPKLEYDFDDLEPYIDGATVRAHYNGHHESYRKKMNEFLQKWRSSVSSKLPYQSLYQILQNLNKVPHDLEISILNNVGGYVNHALYWSILSPNPSKQLRLPEGHLLERIKSDFDSFDEFKNKFTAEALKLFGSGYVWLVSEKPNFDGSEGRLRIVSSSNQDSPITFKLLPLLVIDVWEHAYYLKHQYKRVEHVEDFWYLVDWKKVDALVKFWEEFNWELHGTYREDL
ncbi:hypothetical protein HELRODRAFT_78629 [Helobdella robusta]|uniref:Superoxide dismutase n=1 Tax=Helobdella robusta TaxID=6412 RepID=T1G3D8_HELRO|nr:hypothetical protein HELRODRAFT_78629 [Helobdella robusta]ESO04737.1 hypothetical protein HELRODRAFT_78629 [Helobdella robusta]